MMDQLIDIAQQRSQSKLALENGQPVDRAALIEQERKRAERENWMLRMLKSFKVFSADQKKNIQQATLKIMALYGSIPRDIEEGSIFSETMINLFVEFYNQFPEMDLAPIKTIIRPNNAFIIVDLIKSLLQLGRKQFKTALQVRYNQEMSSRVQRTFSLKCMAKPSSSHHSRPSLDDTNKTVPVRKGPFFSEQQKINHVLFEKYNKFTDNLQAQQLHQRANEIYFDLRYLNQRNSIRIQKYFDSCFGAKRHLAYDANGLYTQVEIKEMLKEHRAKMESKLAEQEQPKVGASSKSLKQRFRNKVELHGQEFGLPVTQRQTRMRQWFPYVLVKNGNRLNPYNLLIEVNGTYYTGKQFQDRYGKKVKVYTKQLILEWIGQYYDEELLTHPEFLSFPKRQYFEGRLSDFLARDSCIIKRDTALPPIIQPMLQELDPKKKAKSVERLRDKTVVMPQLQAAPSASNAKAQEQVSKRLNYSSFVKEMGSRKHIDKLIDSILRNKTRTLT